jgi:hypothetical protein
MGPACAGTTTETMSSFSILIGNTPLVEVTRIECGLCRLFPKLESK